VQLSPGDLFTIYSDGITEAENHREEEFGEERLLDVMARARDLSPSHIVSTVFDEVRRFSGGRQRDDVTLIVARCTGVGAMGRARTPSASVPQA
jgi:sigma-B regulation protein RsbU (phosphoserine phosphatase)